MCVAQAGALLAGLILTDVPNVGKAVTIIEPLTCLFGGMYLGSLGMILSPVRQPNNLSPSLSSNALPLSSST